MSVFRPYKFLIVPVIQEVSEDGEVIREVNPEQPTQVFGVEGLRRFADTFEIELAANTINEGNLDDGRRNSKAKDQVRQSKLSR